MDPGDQTDEFEAHRKQLFAIAYRMLGSVADAEDIPQEAYVRYQAAARESILSHRAFLTTVVTRLCLNKLQFARVQRETYLGPWLPEPLLTAAASFAARRRAPLSASARWRGSPWVRCASFRGRTSRR
jgi:RNA polymerase sigma-70 factor (ECF subfamily)